MERLKQLPNDYEAFGRQQANIEWQKTLVLDLKERMHKTEQLTAQCITRNDEQDKQIRDVDIFGSRKHIMSAPEASRHE